MIKVIPGSTDTDVTRDEFLDKAPHPPQTIDHGNGITQVFDGDGNERWYRNGKRHRDGDKPAVLWLDGSQWWYRDGLCHRDGDKPAITLACGNQWWYRNGICHRDTDLPAAIRSDGTQYWYRHGVLHRDGGKPAVIYGVDHIFSAEELTRRARYPNGDGVHWVEYWVDGVIVAEEEAGSILLHNNVLKS